MIENYSRGENTSLGIFQAVPSAAMSVGATRSVDGLWLSLSFVNKMAEHYSRGKSMNVGIFQAAPSAATFGLCLSLRVFRVRYIGGVRL